MQVLRVVTTNGIDDIKLIGETEMEREFIKQLAESGTLSCISKEVADTALFRPISVTPEMSTYTSTRGIIGRYNFIVRQNQDKTFDLKFVIDGDDLDLTEFTAIKLQIANHKGSSAIIELAVGSGLTISPEFSNVLNVTLTAAQTASLKCQEYFYDVLMSMPSSNRYYVEGKITVKKSQSR